MELKGKKIYLIKGMTPFKMFIWFQVIFI